jgi:hypothetical protein
MCDAFVLPCEVKKSIPAHLELRGRPAKAMHSFPPMGYGGRPISRDATKINEVRRHLPAEKLCRTMGCEKGTCFAIAGMDCNNIRGMSLH